MNEVPPSREQSAISLIANVTERIRRGENPDAVYTDLVAQGMPPNIAATLVVQSTPGKLESGGHGWTLRIIGIVIILLGGLLWYGNKYGSFPTIPFAGAIVMVFGVIIYVKGGGS